eukprot:TRINITY_DN1710_c0_g1_i1.p1 TRINITY_DN1710_c0_g1~~TRINITY_DN1710_c0_g1_i1.p1  ORF type:complete len:426 (-),score=166.76 TRINITY_DN1710_c0_g1_i1:113-1390(-)
MSERGRSSARLASKPAAPEKAAEPKKSSVKGGIKKKAPAEKKAKAAGGKHPPFAKMITASLKDLAKEGEGSVFSVKRITETIEKKYPTVDVNSPSYKRWLSAALAAGVDDKRFVQVRKSYRVSAKALHGKRKSRSKSPVKGKKRAASKSRSKSPAAKKAKSSRSKSPAAKKSTDKKKTTDKKEKKEKKETKSRSKSPAAKKSADKKEKAPKEKKAKATKSKEKAEKPPKEKKAKAAKPAAKPKKAAKEKAPPRKLLLLRKSSSLVGSFVEPAAAPEQRYAVAFNTTDLANVRESLRDEIKGLIDAGVSIGLIANRGYLAEGRFNLERTDFTSNVDDLVQIINNAFGEGADWDKYYKEVLQSANQLPWEGYTAKTLVLIGSEDGVKSLVGQGLQQEVQALNNKGVNVFAFNNEQLALLADVVTSLK